MADNSLVNQTDEFLRLLRNGISRDKAMQATGVTYEEYNAIRKGDRATELIEAEEFGADIMADRLLNVHEEMPAKVAEVASANMRWYLSKRARKTYGEKVDINQTSTLNILAIVDEVNQRANQYLTNISAPDVIEHVPSALTPASVEVPQPQTLDDV